MTACGGECAHITRGWLAGALDALGRVEAGGAVNLGVGSPGSPRVASSGVASSGVFDREDACAVIKLAWHALQGEGAVAFRKVNASQRCMVVGDLEGNSSVLLHLLRFFELFCFVHVLFLLCCSIVLLLVCGHALS